MSAPMSPERLDEIAALLGPEQQPAQDGLVLSLAESARDRRVHEHQAEDWFCVNLAAWSGERMPAVLRRLMDAEAEVGRLRAELNARPTRAEADAEVQAATDGMREAWTAEVEHVQRQLADRPRRAEVLRQEAGEIAAHCPEHGTRDGCWPECHCAVADEMLRRVAAEQGESGGAR